MEDPESKARAELNRGLLIYSVFLAVDVVVIAYIASTRASGAGLVTLTIVGGIGVLLAYQVVQHLRDLRVPLAESEGVVQRKWSRADLIIAWHSYYLTVDRTVFRVQPEDFALIDEGMYVKVVHFPNTLNVVSIHEVLRPPPDPSARI